LARLQRFGLQAPQVLFQIARAINGARKPVGDDPEERPDRREHEHRRDRELDDASNAWNVCLQGHARLL
jgi:hypothetical protein